MKTRLVLGCIAAFICGTALAQDPPDDALEPVAEPVEAGQGAAPKPPAKGKPAPPPPVTDPVVKLVVESNPQTPRDLVHTIDSLIKLDAAVYAGPFVKRLLAAKVRDDVAAALVEEFGTAMFLRVAASTPLAPEGNQVAGHILTAAHRFAHDPKRIAAHIAALQSPDGAVRAKALLGFIAGGQDATQALIAVLADPNRARDHAAVRGALARLGSNAFHPLVAVLETSRPDLKASVIEVLGRMDRREAVIYLLGPYASPDSNEAVRSAAATALRALVGSLPSQGEARHLLRRNVLEYFSGERPMSTDVEGRAEIWHWDDAKRVVTPVLYPARQASMIVAARLANDLYALAPNDAQVRKLYYTSRLQADAYRSGAIASAGVTAQVLKQLGAEPIDVVADILRFSIETRQFRAATAAAVLLGEHGTQRLLSSDHDEPSPLVAALRADDDRLRFAALESIMKLKPDRPFTGSSFVPETAAFFASSAGLRKAIVAHPRLGPGQQMAGMLGELGFEPDIVTNGNDVVRMAAKSPDYEVALISAAIDRPPVGELVQQLRDDPRAAAMPIAVIVEEIFGEVLEPEEPSAKHHPLAIDARRPYELEGMKQLLALLPSEPSAGLVPADERIRQAELSIGWLAELSKRQEVFSLREVEPVAEEALYQPRLAPAAAAWLANMGTASSQRALVNMASRDSQPLAVRQVAAKAFGDSVRRFGIRLTSAEILRQYDRYNQSEALDKSTQDLLGSILDAMEARGMQSASAKQ